jgi:hypothetical protein
MNPAVSMLVRQTGELLDRAKAAGVALSTIEPKEVFELVTALSWAVTGSETMRVPRADGWKSRLQVSLPAAPSVVHYDGWQCSQSHRGQLDSCREYAASATYVRCFEATNDGITEVVWSLLDLGFQLCKDIHRSRLILTCRAWNPSASRSSGTSSCRTKDAARRDSAGAV